MAKMVVVELRPGVHVRMTPAEVKSRGLKPYEPGQTKKSAPAAAKKRRKAEPIEIEEELEDGLCDD